METLRQATESDLRNAGLKIGDVISIRAMIKREQAQNSNDDSGYANDDTLSDQSDQVSASFYQESIY